MGSVVPPDDLYATDPSGMRKVMDTLKVWDKADAKADLEAKFIEAVKSKLRPGDVMKDMLIAYCGRVDLAQQLAKRLQQVLPIEGAITFTPGGLMDCVAGVWGESITIQYWI